MQYQQETQAKVSDLEQQVRDNNDEKKTPILPVEIPGLKVQVCTLVAPDSPPDKWDYVYVHAKLMIVDDVFMTLGSANINLRSMAVDSELNICHENMAVTQPLRRRLWGLHTKGFQDGASDSPKDAFKARTYICRHTYWNAAQTCEVGGSLASACIAPNNSSQTDTNLSPDFNLLEADAGQCNAGLHTPYSERLWFQSRYRVIVMHFVKQ